VETGQAKRIALIPTQYAHPHLEVAGCDGHDDQVDAASGAHQQLARVASGTGPAVGEATRVPSLRSIGM
jgi:hypothetical protein